MEEELIDLTYCIDYVHLKDQTNKVEINKCLNR